MRNKLSIQDSFVPLGELCSSCATKHFSLTNRSLLVDAVIQSNNYALLVTAIWHKPLKEQEKSCQDQKKALQTSLTDTAARLGANSANAVGSAISGQEYLWKFSTLTNEENEEPLTIAC